MTRFDETIDITTKLLKEFSQFDSRMEDLTLVRDLSGAITVVIPDGLLNDQERDRLVERLHDALGGYSSGVRRLVLEHAELIDPDDILNSPYRVQIPDEAIYLVDRLFTNQEWLLPPLTERLPLPTAAAFSIKGGVGRSTAMAVWAWALARQGKRVLVMDLDLEAPGISSLLLDELPDYGLVDWMVESLARQADETLLEAMLRESPLGKGCDGKILVIPAYGQQTRDYVAKLGRIYLPSLEDNGAFYGLAHRLAALLQMVASRSSNPPDVVLLDVRAGLQDIGAAVMSQLPTEVFLFARDDRQTWEAYQQLFTHLRQSRSVAWGMEDQDLRWRLKMVAAQLGWAQSDFSHSLSRSFDVWSASLYDTAEGSAGEPLSFSETEETAPHFPIPIYHDPFLANRGLLDPEQRPAWEVVERTFGHFITAATKRLLPALEPELAESDDEP